MVNTPGFIYFVVCIAFIFDFLNGLHDAPNSVATIVATRVLKPLTAILWAAFFNFIAFLFFKLSVANTIGGGLVLPSIVTPYLLFCTLVGAISWNFITWRFGLPSSSSHALIGGLIGSTLMMTGWSALNLKQLLPVLLALILSPTIGLLLSGLLIYIAKKLQSRIPPTLNLNGWAKISQFISAACLSLGHGGNDAQKTMGLISILLFSGGLLGDTFYVPFWVVMFCNLVMGLGTLCGGWRIIRTMGQITPLTPLTGSCAASSAAITLLIANQLGIPISTTHTVTGAIIGSGFYRDKPNIYWPTVYQILWCWLLTIPSAGLIAATIMQAGRVFKIA